MIGPAEKLERDLYQTCDVARRAGYNPTLFLQMLGESGGVGTVQRLLATGEQHARTQVRIPLPIRWVAPTMSVPYFMLLLHCELNLRLSRISLPGLSFPSM